MTIFDDQVATPARQCRINNWITSDDDAYLEDACEACVGQATYQIEGEYYCVMHYPSQDKITKFRAALKQKTDNNDFNFCCVYFPEKTTFGRKSGSLSKSEQLTYEKVDFRCATFSNDVFFTHINFKDAKFEDAIFKGNAYFNIPWFNIYPCSFHTVDFSNTIFHGEAYFNNAIFNNDAKFQNVRFDGKANFSRTKFRGKVGFQDATFSGLTLFTGTVFENSTDFSEAQFKEYVKFKQGNDEMFGAEASLTFDSLRIEKPERLSFHSVNLRPHWFINTDPRKFEFIDVRWDDDLAKESEASKSPRLLSIAYRQLAMNAEENNRYGEAAQFRYNSMDLRRLEKLNGYAFWTLDFWYWALSGYGERVGHATVALLLILFLSCVPYWFTGFRSPSKEQVPKEPLPVSVIFAKEQSSKAMQSIVSWLKFKIDMAEDTAQRLISTAKFLDVGIATFVYSLETASLQKPEPRPVTTMARLFVGLETILAPLQAALLALAIRRKYIR